MPVAVHAFPHPVHESLSLEAREAFDPSEPALVLEFQRTSGGGPDGALCLDLVAVPNWREVRCRLVCGVAREVLERVAPDLVESPESVRVFVSVRCPVTKYRRAIQ